MAHTILIFSLAYYPRNVGGAEVALQKITDRIAKDTILFHMVTHRFYADQPDIEYIGNIVVHRVGTPFEARLAQKSSLFLYVLKMMFVVRAAKKGISLHKEIGFNGLWAMMSYMAIPIMLMRMWGIRIPYVITLQEGDSKDHVFKRLQILPFLSLLQKAFREATHIQAISHFLAEWARELGYTGSVQVIPNGVDVALFSHDIAHADVERMQQTIGKKTGEVWLIHTGRYVEKNALDTVLRALPLLPPYVHFFALGEGPEEKALRRLAVSLGVDERYHTHPYVHIDSIPQFLKACDIFVRPSRSEGMGNSFVEAMAASIPVIGTRAGGIVDFLSDGSEVGHQKTGWVVRIDAPQDIADAVLCIVNHTSEVTEVLREAQTLVTDRYNWDSIAQAMESHIFSSLFIE